jgi:hypothetical protein
MNPTNQISPDSQMIAVSGTEKWDVYHRLQDLGISCQCSMHKALSVDVSSPNEVAQVWSVVRRVTSSRESLVKLLKCCWEISSVF